MSSQKLIEWERRPPTAADFVRMMEAWAAYMTDESGDKPNEWGKVYRLAHVCFAKVGTQEDACPHPEWNKEFWEQYDAVKSYWED